MTFLLENVLCMVIFSSNEFSHVISFFCSLKISASGLQSTELFFQVALKFLHLASDSTPRYKKNANKGEMTSAEMYGNTAKLCE